MGSMRSSTHLLFTLRTLIESCTKAFPGHSHSPTRYARVLSLHGLDTPDTAGTHGFAWVHTFHDIVDSRLSILRWPGSQSSLVPGVVPHPSQGSGVTPLFRQAHDRDWRVDHSYDPTGAHRVPLTQRQYPHRHSWIVGPPRLLPLRQDRDEMSFWGSRFDNGFRVEVC